MVHQKLLTLSLQSHESKLLVLPWVTIFTVCTNTIWIYPHEWQAGLLLIAALAALNCVAITFTHSPLGKWITLALGICPLWAFGAQNDLPTKLARWTKLSHPISILAEEARARFVDTQRRQSLTLHDAVVEYQRRYGRSPPPGFDVWHGFVIEHDVQLVDEYDSLTKSLEPFWQVSPMVLRDYVDHAILLENLSLTKLEIKSHNATLEPFLKTQSFHHAQFTELLKPVVSN